MLSNKLHIEKVSLSCVLACVLLRRNVDGTSLDKMDMGTAVLRNGFEHE